MKKALGRVIIALLFVWLIVSIYFYMQHNTTIWRHTINQQVDLGDVKIHIEEISVRNYQRNDRLILKNDFINGLAVKLPQQMILPFFTVVNFYSKPYVINKDYGVVGVKGQYISDHFRNDEQINNILENIFIAVVDDIGVHYKRSSTQSHQSGSDVIDFETGGDYFAFEKMDSALKVVIKDKREEKTTEISVLPNFTKESYNFFNKMPELF